ncbi:hypothetical protein VF21_03705 [Pseudogymnoascus sp. 05NY08]|nr:hypothetical protein VF21_03705 [Pseudogymnoascus sp. 05NY08]
MASEIPQEYLFDDDHQFPPEQAEAIIRTTSYHRKDFDLAVIWFPDREHQGIRTSISSSFQRPSTSTEPLGRLPQELLNNIFLSLDMHSVTKCRQVNLRLRQAVDSLPEYQVVSTHGLTALCALLRTRLARNVSLFDFYQALCRKNCSLCSRFAGFIFLPTWRRCCFICLQMGSTEFQMHTVPAIQEQFPLSMDEISKLTSFETLPGTYSMKEHVQKDRITIISVAEAMRASGGEEGKLVRPGPPWFPQNPKLAFMATCVLPYYDRQTRTAEYGISCAGSQLYIDKGKASGMALKFAYMARDFVYTREGFLEHVKECWDALLLWESSKGGSIEPPELPEIAKNGGYLKPRE